METVGKITLYEDTAYFYIAHDDAPTLCKINRDATIWKGLKADMKQYGQLLYKKKEGLCFGGCKGKLRFIRLPAYLYARYNGLSLKAMRGHSVRQKNKSTGDILDHTSGNLYIRGQG